jgi:hypothetical protein
MVRFLSNLLYSIYHHTQFVSLWRNHSTAQFVTFISWSLLYDVTTAPPLILILFRVSLRVH